MDLPLMVFSVLLLSGGASLIHYANRLQHATVVIWFTLAGFLISLAGIVLLLT